MNFGTNYLFYYYSTVLRALSFFSTCTVVGSYFELLVELQASNVQVVPVAVYQLACLVPVNVVLKGYYCMFDPIGAPLYFQYKYGN